MYHGELFFSIIKHTYIVEFSILTFRYSNDSQREYRHIVINESCLYVCLFVGNGYKNLSYARNYKLV